jgi:ABC-type multidrug transport system fused ATPase/permease subunit
LERIAEDRTTLVIAHRLSIAIDADQILVMEGGRIVERGSHRELLERGEVYARRWAAPAAGGGQAGHRAARSGAVGGPLTPAIF